MDDRKHSISSRDLYVCLGSEAAPIVIDVREDDDFAEDGRLIVPGFHRSPEDVEQWRRELPGGRPVVTYCFHGRHVSQGVTTALRLMGVDANFLEGGIAKWTEQGLPTRRNIGTSPGKWVTREHPKIDRIACDKTLPDAGRIALWTEGDSAMRFDSVTIAPVTASEHSY